MKRNLQRLQELLHELGQALLRQCAVNLQRPLLRPREDLESCCGGAPLSGGDLFFFKGLLNMGRLLEKDGVS